MDGTCGGVCLPQAASNTKRHNAQSSVKRRRILIFLSEIYVDNFIIRDFHQK
jgi:hypothetical protein